MKPIWRMVADFMCIIAGRDRKIFVAWPVATSHYHFLPHCPSCPYPRFSEACSEQALRSLGIEAYGLNLLLLPLFHSRTECGMPLPREARKSSFFELSLVKNSIPKGRITAFNA